MSNTPEYMTVISPLLTNKIDEISNMISSNLENLKYTVTSLTNKIDTLEKKFDNLEKKLKTIENTQNNLDLISNDYWHTSD
jgi:chaperonin cofactor prefoldin